MIVTRLAQQKFAAKFFSYHRFDPPFILSSKTGGGHHLWRAPSAQAHVPRAQLRPSHPPPDPDTRQSVGGELEVGHAREGAHFHALLAAVPAQGLQEVRAA